MNAPNTRKLMMLSSTINTLIGGTELSSKPDSRLGASIGFGFFRFLSGLGEEMRGVGGVEVCRTMGSAGAGGVGMGGLPVEECLSDAEESCLVLCGRVELADWGTPPVNVVGEAVLLRGILGRLL